MKKMYHSIKTVSICFVSDSDSMERLQAEAKGFLADEIKWSYARDIAVQHIESLAEVPEDLRRESYWDYKEDNDTLTPSDFFADDIQYKEYLRLKAIYE